MGSCIVHKKKQIIKKNDRFKISSNGKITEDHSLERGRVDDSITMQHNAPKVNQLYDDSTRRSGGDYSFNRSMFLKSNRTLKVTKNEDDKISFKVFLNRYEETCPIWLKENETIKIKVKGSWCLNKEYGFCNSEGYPLINSNFKSVNSLPYGALLGRMLDGDCFVIKENSELFIEKEGPLMLSTNYDYFYQDSEGCLDITITGCELMNIKDIDEKLGWNYNIVDNVSTLGYLNSEEKKQYILINKIRTNPTLFADLYIKHLINKNKSFRELYEFMKGVKAIRPLIPNLVLHNVCLLQASFLGDTGSTGHLSSTGEELYKRLKQLEIFPKYFCENQSYSNFSTNDIIMGMLLDELTRHKDRRENLLRNCYNEIGIAIYPHLIYGICSIQILTSELMSNLPSSPARDHKLKVLLEEETKRTNSHV